MNVIPNTFLNSSTIHESSTTASPKPRSQSSLMQCVVCEEVLSTTTTDDHHPKPQMLAVRPSIGLPAGPFFPILESLTHTSAVRVPCCNTCAKSLLDQWNEYESKNVVIKNRVYNLVTKNYGRQENKSRSGHSANGTKEATCQDEVLDLSMSTSTVNTKQSSQLIAASLANQSSFANLTKINAATAAAAVNSAGRPRTGSASSSDIVTATISPFFNSSMTNLIKVTSNPASLASLKSFHQPVESSNSSSPRQPPPAAQSSLFSCALCDEPCHQLMSIMIRPMGNCPYFPTLIPYIKSSMIDASGKIGTCESCHRQLIQQWDSYHKSNKPITERHYQLIRATKPNTVLNFPFLSDSNNSRTTTHIPLISQPASTKSLLMCVVCGKDLLLSASNPMTSSMQTAFSLLTENETSGATTIRKLVIPGAQEINLLTFLSTSPANISLQQHHLQLLHDSGRVLVCYLCFENIASRANTTAAANINCINNSNNQSSNCNSSNADQVLIKNSRPQDSVNGIVQKSSNENNNEVPISDLLCLACGHNKAQYLVETKENCSKSPFFPFLRDSSEPNGRARICGACHLMLETQWDAFEAAYVSYSQRNYRLPSSSTSQNNLLLTKRPFSVVSSSPTSSSAHSRSNGQPTPPPLKIHISSPSIQPTSSVNSSSHTSDHLLLTTVSNSQNSSILNHQATSTATSHSSVTDDERIFKLINEFLSNLGGPHSVLSGNCTVCNETSPVGKTYQVFSSSRKILLSPELGVYPYFPMLKNCKKTAKNMLESAHLVCTFCYHSLIAQWAAYHLSTYPEDRDLNNRIYNCRDFICYVCGVTTYRPLVRSIAIKDFPFLLEHKRPPGALSLCKGESVVTCLNCFETLTHQWIENERMKVPLEMRKYNWMAVPPPPLSKSDSDNKTSIHSDIQRTVFSGHSMIPSNNSHNGLSSAINVTSKFPPLAPIEIRPTTMPVAPPVVFNPSHTLAPLVAAAMAATPVTTKQHEHVKPNDSIVVSSGNNSFADVLRHLARQQSIHLQKNQPIVNYTNSSNNSINLTTLASVAALAGNHRTAALNSDTYLTNSTTTTSNAYSAAHHPNEHHHSNDFGQHISNTANSIDTLPRNLMNHNSASIKEECDARKSMNNTHHSDLQRKSFNNVKQEMTDETNEPQFDKCLSRVNVEEIKLRRKRLARLARIKSNSQSLDNLSDLSDEELAIELGSPVSSEPDHPIPTRSSDSLLQFIESVIPVLELDTDSPKLEFMSKLGLITHQAKRELELDQYVKRISSRKLCSAGSTSFQFDDENDILLIDPDYEEFPSGAHFRPTDILPSAKELHADNDKNDFMKSLGLKSSKVEVQLQTELTWLAVIQNRHSRRKRRIVCVGKTYNNLSDKVLNTWLPQLASSLNSSTKQSVSELTEQLGDWISSEHHLSVEVKEELNNKTIKGTLCLDSNNVESNDNHSTNTVASTSVNSNTKILNTKQFAQEFHELVLLETQKQMSKQSSSVVADPVSSAHAQHTIIYSDHLKPPHNDTGSDASQNQTVVNVQDKLVREQVFKLQQRLADINRETQFLNEKKSEILESLQKLSDERNTCHIELDRLTKCLDLINTTNI